MGKIINTTKKMTNALLHASKEADREITTEKTKYM